MISRPPHLNRPYLSNFCSATLAFSWVRLRSLTCFNHDIYPRCHVTKYFIASKIFLVRSLLKMAQVQAINADLKSDIPGFSRKRNSEKGQYPKNPIFTIWTYLAAVTGPLSILLIISCIYLLIQTDMDSRHDRAIRGTLEKSQAIYGLVTRLQVERGLTCVYLTAKK